ncbi:MAG: hypothetical protein IJ248_06665 [Candidatus Methanomethylophilaceae archaeon]|nr:hypothetical protein [Candidatus Methanomethylophilaceae archaeon]
MTPVKTPADRKMRIMMKTLGFPTPPAMIMKRSSESAFVCRYAIANAIRNISSTGML